jgi:mRNA interferase RelE/StbE
MNLLPAQQIFAQEFDADYFRLPKRVQELIERKIDEMGARLADFSHTRLKGASGNYRLRVGDYRVIYDFDLARNVIVLKLVGHRREIYR